MDVFLTRLTLLMPAFSLLSAPPRLTPTASVHQGPDPHRTQGYEENAPLPPRPANRTGATASVTDLSPGTSSAQNPSNSELLRTL